MPISPDLTQTSEFGALERWLVHEIVSQQLNQHLTSLTNNDHDEVLSQFISSLARMPFTKSVDTKEFEQAIKDIFKLIPTMDATLHKLSKRGIKTWLVNVICGPLLSNARASRLSQRDEGTSSPSEHVFDLMSKALKITAMEGADVLIEEFQTVYSYEEMRDHIRVMVMEAINYLATSLQFKATKREYVTKWRKLYNTIPFTAFAMALKMHVGTGLLDAMTRLFFSKIPFTTSLWERLVSEMLSLETSQATLERVTAQVPLHVQRLLDEYIQDVEEDFTVVRSPEETRSRKDHVVQYLQSKISDPTIITDKLAWSCLAYSQKTLEVKFIKALIRIVCDDTFVHPFHKLVLTFQNQFVSFLLQRGTGLPRAAQTIQREWDACLTALEVTGPPLTPETTFHILRNAMSTVATTGITVIHTLLGLDQQNGVLRETIEWVVDLWNNQDDGTAQHGMQMIDTLRQAFLAETIENQTLIMVEAKMAFDREVANASVNRTPGTKRTARPHFKATWHLLGRKLQLYSFLDHVIRFRDYHVREQQQRQRRSTSSFISLGEVDHFTITCLDVVYGSENDDAAPAKQLRERGYKRAAGEGSIVWFRLNCDRPSRFLSCMPPIVDITVVTSREELKQKKGGDGDGWVFVPRNLNKNVPFALSNAFLAYRRRRQGQHGHEDAIGVGPFCNLACSGPSPGQNGWVELATFASGMLTKNTVIWGLVGGGE